MILLLYSGPEEPHPRLSNRLDLNASRRLLTKRKGNEEANNRSLGLEV